MTNISKKTINLALVGFGKVGRVVADYLNQDPDCRLQVIIDRSDPQANFNQISTESLKDVSVIIDFTQGEAVLPLVKSVAKINPRIRIVSGSSGWNQLETRVRKVVSHNKLYFLYGANFSIGTAIFFRLVNVSAELFNKFPGFDPAVLDIHHRHKQDMPSGTAKKIAQNIIQRYDTKNRILYGMAERAIRPNELHVNCLRVGENKGFHEVYFDAPDEIIKLSQQTRDRGAYAHGSIAAAKWLMTQTQPGFYTFDDYIAQQISKLKIRRS